MSWEDASTITIDLCEDDLRCAKHIAEGLGVDLAAVTCAFYRQIIRDQMPPLSLMDGGWLYNRAFGWRELYAVDGR